LMATMVSLVTNLEWDPYLGLPSQAASCRSALRRSAVRLVDDVTATTAAWHGVHLDQRSGTRRRQPTTGVWRWYWAATRRLLRAFIGLQRHRDTAAPRFCIPSLALPCSNGVPWPSSDAGGGDRWALDGIGGAAAVATRRRRRRGQAATTCGALGAGLSRKSSNFRRGGLPAGTAGWWTGTAAAVHGPDRGRSRVSRTKFQRGRESTFSRTTLTYVAVLMRIEHV
jgi:hypothetical protein